MLVPWVQLKGCVFADQEYEHKIEAALRQWDVEAAEMQLAEKKLRREVNGMFMEGEQLESML